MTKADKKLSIGGILTRTARLPLIAYLVVLLFMTLIETWLVYPAPPLDRSDWSPGGDEHQEVWIGTETDQKIHGWFYDNPDAERTLLYCHGNGEQVADNHALMRLLRDRLEATVLIFDYRGYGKSAGKPHEKGVIADGLAAHRWLADRQGVGTDQVTLMGRSLGGGVAVALADELGAAALILESTFTRLTDAAASHYPWLPVRWLMRNRYDSISRIADYRGPLWISHGTADKVVPFSHAESLFSAAKSPQKKLFSLENQGHNDLPPASYYSELAEFLKSAADSGQATQED